ncbi:MAG: hypothetical protein JKP90_04010 [Desulfofustis sp. PB-SRB1]|nr:hypothetical protein [Desulfofustis sp. PB-SRB1]
MGKPEQGSKSGDKVDFTIGVLVAQARGTEEQANGKKKDPPSAEMNEQIYQMIAEWVGLTIVPIKRQAEAGNGPIYCRFVCVGFGKEGLAQRVK